MIKLNLLPDKNKEQKGLEETTGFIFRLGFSVIFAFLVLLVIFLAMQMVLNIELKSAREESRAQSGKTIEEIQKAENFLKDINAVSQKVNKTSGAVPHWSKIFKRLSEICPEGVKLTSIHIEKEHVKIEGFAKTREDFLDFQEKLKEEGFQNLVSPVSNVVSPKDFIFTVELDADKKYLNQP